MRIAVDTNLLVRVIVRDDEDQAEAARRIMTKAELVAISLPCLCELYWVLSSTYGYTKPRIAVALGTLLATANVATNFKAAEVGLALMAAGGDFADGVIAQAGKDLGGEMFVSFDRRATSRLIGLGVTASHVSELA